MPCHAMPCVKGAGQAPCQPPSLALQPRRRGDQPRAAAVRPSTPTPPSHKQGRLTPSHLIPRPACMHAGSTSPSPSSRPAATRPWRICTSTSSAPPGSCCTARTRSVREVDGSCETDGRRDGSWRIAIILSLCCTHTHIQTIIVTTRTHTPNQNKNQNNRWRATRTSSPSGARPGGTAPPPPCCGRTPWR